MIGHAVVVPQELAVAGPHSDEAAAQKLHVLLHPAPVRDHDRGVAGAVLAPGPEVGDGGPPDLLARLLVESHEGRVLRPWGDHHPVSVHQGRLAELPDRHHRAAEVPGQAPAPALGARCGLHAHQVALGADRVHEVAVHGGCASGPAHLVVPGGADPGRPERLAVRSLERHELLGAGFVAHGEETVPRDGHARKADANAGGRPGQRRSRGRPGREKAMVRGEAVAARPAPAGPVGGRRREKTGGQRETQGERSERMANREGH